MEANKISIPLRGNDKLAAIIAGVGTGDCITLKDVKFTVDESTQELVTGTIDEVGDASVDKVPQPGDVEDDVGEEEAKKRGPVMSVMASDKSTDNDDRSRDALY